LDDQELEQRLSRISTAWTAVAQARDLAGDAVTAAYQAMLSRYSGAIYRYLLGALHNPDAADEVFQEFALRLVKGAFKGADPQRGRFRDLIKKALFHLIVDYQRRQGKQLQPLPSGDLSAPDPEPDSDEAGREFLERWRAELLARSWEALAGYERQTGRLYHTVLRFRAQNPQMPSGQMAATLTRRLAKPLTAEGTRQILHRAREKFAEYLIEEVAQSLPAGKVEDVEEELLDLGLLIYCKPILDRRQQKS
jgi:RNA polymerase sigma-70 factor (ECF subfamily)